MREDKWERLVKMQEQQLTLLAQLVDRVQVQSTKYEVESSKEVGK